MVLECIKKITSSFGRPNRYFVTFTDDSYCEVFINQGKLFILEKVGDSNSISKVGLYFVQLQNNWDVLYNTYFSKYELL